MIEDVRLWHVTVTVSGDANEPHEVARALRRLSEQRPFLLSLRYAGDRAEVQYWEEAETMLDAASLGLRLWAEHRESADLPRWEVVGLEVLERGIYQTREQFGLMVDLRDVTPVPF